ncbi:MAG: thiamine phosphate synthase [Proteobacteria bacterium]|jgi:thiamine-phosphate pyrophosphorylase|nr:thiamine phosphate synthase [Pseudomonadota bacterium]
MRARLEIGLYGILTDPVVGYERLAEIMVRKGLRIIQLRVKGAPRAEVVAIARRVRAVVPPGVAFIVNDDPEIAVEVGAAGVHLGQGDLPYADARRIVGDAAIVGLSTHNPAQTEAACALGPDYIGVGPVFATPTKRIPDPAIGLDGMRRMLAIATVPAVVLGGIDHGNAAAVVAAGAGNLCAVRCVNGSPEPGAEIDRILAVLRNRC